ncbi:MAG: DUF3127 domain-containing protein [Bacteroidetes bacterium]|nr:MAG: DUF3127 domain-containing protein [Bacteroidota bacterium]
MYKLTGTVKVVNNTVQVSEKFSKREFVVTDSTGMYPQDILFQATQDKCSLLDGVQPGEQIEVSFNLRGREWTSPQGEVKYFNTLEAWRIEKAGMNSGMAANSGMGSMSNDPIPASTPSPIEAASSDEDDDLPF